MRSFNTFDPFKKRLLLQLHGVCVVIKTGYILSLVLTIFYKALVITKYIVKHKTDVCCYTKCIRSFFNYIYDCHFIFTFQVGQ